MKKTLTFIVLFLLTSILLISCLPEPKDIQPICKGLYADLLADYPDYPHAFIGFCIATFQAGKPVGFQGVCRSESFWLSMPELLGDEGLVITSRQECINYIESLE